MPRKIKLKRSSLPEVHAPATGPGEVRIIGGKLRGRKLLYSGDERTRPMKDRVREAVFNLVGPQIRGTHAIDLFAGTGAIGLEALSRGAVRATFIEQHFPTAGIIRQNIRALGVEAQTEVIAANTFIWHRQTSDLGPEPLAVFCSPPYEFYVSRAEEITRLVEALWERAPEGSIFVVESDERLSPHILPAPETWEFRDYLPARVGIKRK